MTSDSQAVQSIAPDPPPSGRPFEAGPRTVSWLGGWGVSPERLRPLAKAFPEANHLFLPPTPEAVLAAASSDTVVAWSLGSWRVLEAAARGVPFPGRILLLAPFLAFGSEYGLGGRCSVSQVRWLRRWVERDLTGALADFARRAGLGQTPSTPPYQLEDLLEGLDRLAEDAPASLRAFAAQGLPAGWAACIGAADPLLDPAQIQRCLPGCRVVPGAGHGAEELFAALQGPHAL